MSRIGLMPISVPSGVQVTVAEGNVVTVKGPKGTLTQKFNSALTLKVEDGVIHVIRHDDEQQTKALHGLTRSLLHNMVEGVVHGYSKSLIIEGVGYRAAKQGKNVVLTLGFSHQVTISETEDIKLEVPQPNQIIVSGIDKQKVGQFACEVRAKRPPEPYKGKGIRYDGEVIIRKEGKAGKGAKK